MISEWKYKMHLLSNLECVPEAITSNAIHKKSIICATKKSTIWFGALLPYDSLTLNGKANVHFVCYTNPSKSQIMVFMGEKAAFASADHFTFVKEIHILHLPRLEIKKKLLMDEIITDQCNFIN